MHADHFQPEKILAAGPAAKVYRGVEIATGRKVLMKLLLYDHEATHPLDHEKLQLMAADLLQVRTRRSPDSSPSSPPRMNSRSSMNSCPASTHARLPPSANLLRPTCVRSPCN